MKASQATSLASAILCGLFCHQAHAQLSLNTTEEWQAAQAQSEGITLENNLVFPTDKKGVFRSKVLPVEGVQKAKSLQLKQNPHWLNWEAIEPFFPSNLGDAPIVIVAGPQNYWAFGRYETLPLAEGESEFTPKQVTLEGFDMPLLTTPESTQFLAPGALERNMHGYHAWQSRDLVNWVHHGSVSDSKAKWATSAELVDGKLYLYYDFPNDQDPHLIIDDNLFDGKVGEDKGLAFEDPSDGSDCAVIRDLEGNFHLIYEDWSPINASTHAWDSPLAGRAVSADGMEDFEIKPPAVDYRTTPTGKKGTYMHPHWPDEDPERFTSHDVEYEIHEPAQKAFGDWAAIAIGGRYYLASDYDPIKTKDKQPPMQIGLFTAEGIDKPFEFFGAVGEGHPDPDIFFAEGKFYLASQRGKFFVSDGPWVEKVSVRVGVDETGNGEVDTWTDWQEVKESYDYIDGFAKQIALTPATMSLEDLPAGLGFAFEIQIEDLDEAQREVNAKNTDPRASVPKIDSLKLEFK